MTKTCLPLSTIPLERHTGTRHMALLFQARDPGSMNGPSLPQVSSLRTSQSLTPPDAPWPRGTG